MKNRRMRDRIGPPATILGPGARLNGSLQGEGHFLIAGQVTGDADIEGGLTLAEGGRWQGAIRADDVILAGELDGELLARGRVEITASARVRGRVVGNGISISQGAVVEADLQSMGDTDVVTFDERRKG
ncbi:MAG TPA: polymer-forming cytoskeletal protein [Gammaproteobacteria bacterium]|nr:polymer-forming cytoskeletal protein [Gammaproteobacteria bacterium]